ncbi:ABC transporter ATP-binding protein [Helicobacter pylori]|uniref:ATP-binding cassette domain-containing protein n=1 Tax=Helicobacter pylori TaxID=210 RepID=UPI001237CC52|nr:ABC transporter ATP-binding protein [Helicobacter pylori]KAA6506816.1 ABC transporter ATP-binding protein [Helicobacter pylori]KAA6509898.1 ABC transporter ATP-binding protein [Helicobacter pylori]KAA6514838.1 ABC transporter ATP-binding protein [Helicobacter pylori]
MQTPMDTIKNIPLRTFVLLYKSSPKYVVLASVIVLLIGILPSINILVTIRLIDVVANILQNHTHFEYRLLLSTLLLWGALLFFTHVFLGILSSLQTIIAEQFSTNIITRLAIKLTKVKNLNFFENKDHTIKLNAIHNGLYIRPLNYVSNLFFNLQRIIGLISLFGILFSISIYLPFIMIFATVPCMFITNHIAKKHSASIDKLQDQKESMQNYLYSGLDIQKNKDNLLFSFVFNFYHKFIENKELYINHFVKIAQKNLMLTIYADILTTILSVALFFLMVFIILSKSIGVGAIAGYVQAFSYTEQQLQDLSFYGKWFFTINKYFENYFYILDYKTPKPESQIRLEEKIHSITFENISFSYSNSKPIFENFNLSLSTNKIYALVGRNASGKSTLINLLLGFYTPNSGQIIINNKYPLQDLELNSYHQQMSAIFQDFSLYAGYSIDDNLFMQNNITKEQLKQKREILKSFDEHFQNCLNDCNNTLFGAQYNGVDFSLGQKQRIATIRAFLKPSNCIVLDEPSSAIDPIMEKEFLDFIFKKSQSKMALIITHRMGSVKQADEIIVLDKGKLIEQGNFETLIKKQGLFSELYLKQQY